jgi:hypothetical protein
METSLVNSPKNTDYELPVKVLPPPRDILIRLHLSLQGKQL